MSETQTNATPETVKPKLTRTEKLTQRAELLHKRITTDTNEYNEILAELAGAARLANLAAGDSVQVKLGRAETSRTVNAIVVGVKEDEDGAKKYKVQYGSGFDADIAVVGAAQIILTDTVDPVAVEGDTPQA